MRLRLVCTRAPLCVRSTPPLSLGLSTGCCECGASAPSEVVTRDRGRRERVCVRGGRGAGPRLSGRAASVEPRVHMTCVHCAPPEGAGTCVGRGTAPQLGLNDGEPGATRLLCFLLLARLVDHVHAGGEGGDKNKRARDKDHDGCGRELVSLALVRGEIDGVWPAERVADPDDAARDARARSARRLGARVGEGVNDERVAREGVEP
eukprot:Amastigsp_a847030_6.p3 type:complete len:206 gc:universal Amastigsp_a847030_6:1059-442(-)